MTHGTLLSDWCVACRHTHTLLSMNLGRVWYSEIDKLIWRQCSEHGNGFKGLYFRRLVKIRISIRIDLWIAGFVMRRVAWKGYFSRTHTHLLCFLIQMWDHMLDCVWCAVSPFFYTPWYFRELQILQCIITDIWEWCHIICYHSWKVQVIWNFELHDKGIVVTQSNFVGIGLQIAYCFLFRSCSAFVHMWKLDKNLPLPTPPCPVARNFLCWFVMEMLRQYLWDNLCSPECS